MHFSVINARSLAPKISSLIENFSEYDWSFAVVSETWFVEGPKFEETIRELSLGHGLDAICQNRNPKQGLNTGGGVAILWRKSKIRLKVFTVRKNGCEVVTAKGKIADCNRSIYIIGIYIPPATRRASLDKYRDTLRGIIEKIKIDDREPLIVLAGDFNKYDIAPALEDFLDFRCMDTPPTRGDERLDLIYLNDDSRGFECLAIPPLENDVGGQSDHLTLNAALTFPHHHEFTWVTYRTRDMRAANHVKFIQAYSAIDWEAMIGDMDDPSEMVVRMQNKVDSLTDECFPWRTRKIRSTDYPWIDDHIRRANTI